MQLNAEAKNEIATLEEKECCNTALLSALIHSAGSISFTGEGMGVYIASENQATLQLTSSLVNLLYGAECKQGKNELEIRGSFVPEMLFDLGILTYYGEEIGAYAGINGFVVNDACCQKSYLKGLFLGCGSVSTSKKYHLEMPFSTQDMAEDVCALADGFGITAHTIVRKDKHVVYLKSGEAISDFLALIGANKAVLDLNNTAALRFVNMYTNRRINCDLANADKTVEAGLRQAEAIKKIIGAVADEKLLQVANARIDNPEASYKELAAMLGVGKGCVKYRMDKLMDAANKREE